MRFVKIKEGELFEMMAVRLQLLYYSLSSLFSDVNVISNEN